MTLSQQQSDVTLTRARQAVIYSHPPVWTKKESGLGAAQLRIKNLKIKKVSAREDRPRVLSLMERLRNCWLERLYVLRLKRFRYIQLLVGLSWRFFCFLYGYYLAANLFFKKHKKKWRPLVKQEAFARNNKIPVYMLRDRMPVNTPMPVVFPSQNRGYLVSPHERYEFPKIYVSLVEQAIVHGGSNLTLAGGKAICHDLYDFDRDYTSEEYHLHTFISPKSARICWLTQDDSPEPMPLAATFIDACAGNYAHWTTEVLPRIALFCTDPRFTNVPIVVDEGLHSNIMESLSYVVGNDREIIILSRGRALKVKTLYLTSVAGYVPFDRRNNKLQNHSHGKFSSLALGTIRDIMLDAAAKERQQAWPQKIYIRRNSGIRRVINAAEIEPLLISQGFTIVEPENLTYLHQVQLFSHAKVIIGSSGAALANLVFAADDAKIIVMIGKCSVTSYWYWQNMACASGKTISYILGEANRNGCESIHDDFHVNHDDLLAAIGKIG